MELKAKKIKNNAKIPTRGSEKAAGYDLYANVNAPVYIAPGVTAKIGTGIAIALPEKTFGAIYARSGLATKRGLRPANCVGVIDEDYRGEVIVALRNDSNKIQVITDGERIAQLVVQPYLTPDIVEVDTLDYTERRDGGFGSTGMK